MKLQILVCYSVFTESKYKQGIQNHNSINQQTFFFVRCLVVSPPFSCSTSSSSSSSSSSFLILFAVREKIWFPFLPLDSVSPDTTRNVRAHDKSMCETSTSKSTCIMTFNDRYALAALALLSGNTERGRHFLFRRVSFIGAGGMLVKTQGSWCWNRVDRQRNFPMLLTAAKKWWSGKKKCTKMRTR